MKKCFQDVSSMMFPSIFSDLLFDLFGGCYDGIEWQTSWENADISDIYLILICLNVPTTGNSWCLRLPTSLLSRFFGFVVMQLFDAICGILSYVQPLWESCWAWVTMDPKPFSKKELQPAAVSCIFLIPWLKR